MSIASRIQARLDALGLSERAAAASAGLSPASVNKILNGVSESPRVATLEALAPVLRCSVAFLATGLPVESVGARPSHQRACVQVIRLMAESLILPPAVEPYRLADCVNRWREQRIAEICINEFGDDARAEARRLLQVAGDAGPGRLAIPPAEAGQALVSGKPLGGDAGLTGATALAAPSVSVIERRDGARVSTETRSEAA